jgi:hypothetical protein
MFCLHNETKNHISPPDVGHANKTYRRAVTANAKKTTTVNKVNDSDIIPTAHSSTFGFCRHANPKQKTKRA